MHLSWGWTQISWHAFCRAFHQANGLPDQEVVITSLGLSSLDDDLRLPEKPLAGGVSAQERSRWCMTLLVSFDGPSRRSIAGLLLSGGGMSREVHQGLGRYCRGDRCFYITGTLYMHGFLPSSFGESWRGQMTLARGGHTTLHRHRLTTSSRHKQLVSPVGRLRPSSTLLRWWLQR